MFAVFYGTQASRQPLRGLHRRTQRPQRAGRQLRGVFPRGETPASHTLHRRSPLVTCHLSLCYSKNCLPEDKKLPPGRQKIASRETKNCLQGDKKLPPGRQKIASREAKNCPQGDKKLPPGRQKIAPREAKNCPQGDKKLPPGRQKIAPPEDKELSPRRQTILKYIGVR